MKATGILWTLSAVFCLQTCGVVLHAQDAQLEERLQACARLSNNTERLTCYDRVAINLGDAAAAAPVTSPETMFGVGAKLSREAASAKEMQREQLQSINAQVKMLRVDSGTLLIELDNGQTWQQLENAALLLKAGDAVTITRGALNSFRLSTPSKRSARVKRVQ